MSEFVVCTTAALTDTIADFRPCYRHYEH